MHKINFRFKIIYLFSLSVIFVFPLNSNAQNINYGIKSGLNIAETSLKNGFDKTQNKTGFNIYIFGDYNFTRTFSISTEAGYTQTV